MFQDQIVFTLQGSLWNKMRALLFKDEKIRFRLLLGTQINQFIHLNYQ